MSETTEKPPTGSPDSVPAEPPEPTPPPEQEVPDATPLPEEPEKDHQARRFARMSARLGAIARERDEVAQRLVALEAYARANLPQQPQQPPPDPQAVQQEVWRQRLAEKQRAFHEAGRAAYGEADWAERMKDLEDMRAVPISTTFLIMPDGHKVAAALRDNPEELERILAIPVDPFAPEAGERARAVELGRYAQKLAAQPTRSVSRVPAPPKPVAGRVAPVFVEQLASTDQLIDYYRNQDLQKRRQMNGR